MSSIGVDGSGYLEAATVWNSEVGVWCVLKEGYMLELATSDGGLGC